MWTLFPCIHGYHRLSLIPGLSSSIWSPTRMQGWFNRLQWFSHGVKARHGEVPNGSERQKQVPLLLKSLEITIQYFKNIHPSTSTKNYLPCLFLVDFGTHVWSSSGTKKNIFVTPCWCIIGAETKCSNNNIYGWFLILYPPVFVLKYLRLFIPSYRLKPWKLTFKTLAEYHWTQIYVQWQYLRKRKIRIWKNTWLLFLGSWPDLTWMCSLGILCG